MLYGNLAQFNLSFSGGIQNFSVDTTKAATLMSTAKSASTFASNTLTSGNGADQLYGNAHDLNFTATGATFTNTVTNMPLLNTVTH